MRMFWIFLISLSLIGCVARVYNIQKPRSDLDIQGNRGYIIGIPSTEEVSVPKKKTRTVTIMEIELGPSKIVELEEESAPSEEKKITAEKEIGDIESQISSESESESEVQNPLVVVEEGSSFEIQESTEPQVEQKFVVYKVQKGDTLQKISYKFYGTHKKWKRIYEANKNKLKDPNFIKEGILLKIPR